MAITGTGTQADPWIVQNYSDLSSVFGSISLGYGNYLKLGNDIDCNDYGSSFEWNSLTSTYSTRWYDFDLNGYTIKNVKVANNNYMFAATGNNASTIKNGKILNAFLTGAQSLIIGNGNLLLDNLSMSINGTGVNSFVTDRVFFENCAVYFETSQLTAIPFMNYNEQLPCFKNSDIKLAIDDLNGQRIIGKAPSFGGSTIGLDNCRITGYCKGSTASPVMGTCTANNSVCSVDLTQTTHSGIISVFAGGTGVCNSDLLADDIAAGGNIVEVSDVEIINGAALRAKGFTVVNVKE